MFMINKIEHTLSELKQQSLFRQMQYLQTPHGPHIKIQGKDYLMLSSNSYLGLCGDERLIIAATEAAKLYGTGAGGSRLTTGSCEVHRKLEEEIALFKHTESALVFSSGYAANIGAISSLADKDWVIFSDRLNHASIIDGCRLSGARIVIYEHCDVEDLEKKIKVCRPNQSLIVTDGVFSVDGDIAPLPAIVEIARKHDIPLLVDDAHGTGVLGPEGGGVVDLFHLYGQVDIQMGTMSKALASEGGFIAGQKKLVDYLVNRARSFIFSTALSPIAAAVSRQALEIVRREPEARATLMKKSSWLRKSLRDRGFNLIEGQTPIISLIIGPPDLTVNFSRKLRDRNILISAIRPPTVNQGTSRLRITVMANHTSSDLEFALNSIAEVGRELKVID